MPLPKEAAKAFNAQSKPKCLWAGPGGEGPQGGVTFSLLSRYLACKERFRVHAVEGVRPKPTWDHRMGFGSLWHAAEEALARGDDPTRGGRADRKSGLWEEAVRSLASQEMRRFPLQAETIDHWASVILTQFPLYCKHWAAHPDVQARTPLLQEQAFDVPYELSSGRKVRLRGKFDSVDLIQGKDGKPAIWLQENKTKGDVDEAKIVRQLRFDLQTMLYLIALQHHETACYESEGHYASDEPPHPIAGIRYNVVRRPLSGGKGTIVRHKPTKSNPRGETKAEFYARLGEVIRTASGPEWGIGADQNWFFRRWNSEVSPGDIARFRRECLDPILENLSDDWEWWDLKFRRPLIDQFDSERRLKLFPHHCPRHFTMPFGTYNPLQEGGSTDLDDHLLTGSMIGLERSTNLFPELQE